MNSSARSPTHRSTIPSSSSIHGCRRTCRNRRSEVLHDRRLRRASGRLVGEASQRPWFLYLPFNAQRAVASAAKHLDQFANIKDEKRRTFAAMMSAMDEAVGRVLAKIRDMGQEEDTLIIFLSDNGGPTQQTSSHNGVLRLQGDDARRRRARAVLHAMEGQAPCGQGLRAPDHSA